jgi:cobalt transporter subunit CbtB
MTTTTTSTSQTSAGILPIVFVAALGLGIVLVTGLAHSQTLHDAAHDVRHATGFPCH